LTDVVREEIQAMTREANHVRLTAVLSALSIPSSSWYRRPIPEDERRRPGPKPKPIPEAVEKAVVAMATENPWYGYQRIAVMCRRDVPPGNRTGNRPAGVSGDADSRFAAKASSLQGGALSGLEAL
jgi:hypothetical protein